MKDPPAEPLEGAHLLQGDLVIPPLDLPLHYVTLLLEAPGGSGEARGGGARRGGNPPAPQTPPREPRAGPAHARWVTGYATVAGDHRVASTAPGGLFHPHTPGPVTR